MKPAPIAEILRRGETLPTLGLKAKYLYGHIASLKGGNNRKTSVAIRILETALHNIQMRRLKRAA